MAASKGKSKGEGAAAAGEAEDTDFGAPSNFEDVGTPDIDGWFKPEEGSKFLGQVVGRIQIENDDGKMRDVVLVKLEKPCASAVVEGEDATLDAGQVLGVGVRAKLTELLYYVEKKGRVYAKAVSKQKLKGGRTMWVFEVKGEKGKRANPPAPITRNSAASDGDSDVGF
jgi:hypothetical protein